MKKILILTLLIIAPQYSIAAGLINDMQSCQGILNFVDNKLADAPPKYNKSDVANVRKGLKSYNQYIQNEIVSPGLLQFNQGNKAKADDMQKQVDAYKLTITKQLEQRYPQNRLFADHAIAVNDCAKKAVPSGQALEELKQALQLMLKLAKMN